MRSEKWPIFGEHVAPFCEPTPHLLSVRQGLCRVNEPHFHTLIHIVYKNQEFHCRWDSILFERGKHFVQIIHSLGPTFQMSAHSSPIIWAICRPSYENTVLPGSKIPSCSGTINLSISSSTCLDSIGVA